MDGASAPSSPMIPLIAILPQRADHFGRVAEFGGLKGGAEHHQDFALGHRHIERAEVEEWMTEGENAFAVVIGDCAHAGGRHVAGNQNAGDRFARIQRMFPSGGWFRGEVGRARRRPERR